MIEIQKGQKPKGRKGSLARPFANHPRLFYLEICFYYVTFPAQVFRMVSNTPNLSMNYFLFTNMIPWPPQKKLSTSSQVLPVSLSLLSLLCLPYAFHRLYIHRNLAASCSNPAALWSFLELWQTPLISSFY